MADTDDAPGAAPAPEKNFIAPRDGMMILGLQLLLLLFRLGSVPLLGPDEPRYARVAVEMARANEFTTPTLGGEAWLEKPPLYYWLAGLGYRVLGETEAAARWPAVFAALLLTGFTGAVGARLFGASCGRIAMLILATSPLTFAYGRAATMDMLVAAFITGASGAFILSILGIAGASAVPAAWALVGLAVLAKGPIGVVIPAGLALLLLLLLRRFELRRVASPAALALSAVIAGPWFVAIYADQGFHFIEVFILNHNLERFTSTIHNHPGPVYYYLPVLLLGVFPWTGVAVAAGGALAAVRRDHRLAVLAWMLVPLGTLLRGGVEAPGLHPPLPAAARHHPGPRRPAPRQTRRERSRGARGRTHRTRRGGAVLAALAIRGLRGGEVWGRSAMMPAVWVLATTFMASRAFQGARSDALRVLSTGAAGFLLLLSLVAPPVLEAMESGRRLFLPAQGREVLVAGAWRTAWMAGYFYNDGRVTELGPDWADRIGGARAPTRALRPC
jgi:4-amino-4-deoxy-L-arabinose transferase-like glycosyltransferase